MTHVQSSISGVGRLKVMQAAMAAALKPVASRGSGGCRLLGLGWVAVFAVNAEGTEGVWVAAMGGSQSHYGHLSHGRGQAIRRRVGLVWRA